MGPKLGELKPYFRMQIQNGHLKISKIGISIKCFKLMGVVFLSK